MSFFFFKENDTKSFSMLDIEKINAFGKIQERIIIPHQNKYLGMKSWALGKPVLRSFGEVRGRDIRDSSMSERSPKNTQLLETNDSSGAHLGENGFCIPRVCIQFHYLCNPIKTYRMPKWMSVKLLSLLIMVLFIYIEGLFLRR